MEALGVSGLVVPIPLLSWSAAGLAIGGLLRAIDRRESPDGPSGPSGVGWDGRATLAVGLVVYRRDAPGGPVAAVPGQGRQQRPDLSSLTLPLSAFRL